MPKFKSKSATIDAVQWFKNGDHYEDKCEILNAGDSEGKIVRYFRDPTINSELKCNNCGNAMHFHGWIDTAQGGHTVCPGDWIIKEIDRDGYYPCKSDVFEKRWEEVK